MDPAPGDALMFPLLATPAEAFRDCTAPTLAQGLGSRSRRAANQAVPRTHSSRLSSTGVAIYGATANHGCEHQQTPANPHEAAKALHPLLRVRRIPQGHDTATPAIRSSSAARSGTGWARQVGPVAPGYTPDAWGAGRLRRQTLVMRTPPSIAALSSLTPPLQAYGGCPWRVFEARSQVSGS
jgi:hypothetical protein